MRKHHKGPPRLRHVDGKSYALGLVVSSETRRLLCEAADFAGRSLSKEADYRLQRSFDFERLVDEVVKRLKKGK